MARPVGRENPAHHETGARRDAGRPRNAACGGPVGCRTRCAVRSQSAANPGRGVRSVGETRRGGSGGCEPEAANPGTARTHGRAAWCGESQGAKKLRARESGRAWSANSPWAAQPMPSAPNPGSLGRPGSGGWRLPRGSWAGAGLTGGAAAAAWARAAGAAAAAAELGLLRCRDLNNHLVPPRRRGTSCDRRYFDPTVRPYRRPGEVPSPDRGTPIINMLQYVFSPGQPLSSSSAR